MEALRNNFANQALQSSLFGSSSRKGSFAVEREKIQRLSPTKMEGQPEQCQPTYVDHRIKSQGTITVQMQRINALPDRQSSILFDVILLSAASQVFTVHYLRNTNSTLQADTILTPSSQPIPRRLHHMNYSRFLQPRINRLSFHTHCMLSLKRSTTNLNQS